MSDVINSICPLRWKEDFQDKNCTSRCMWFDGDKDACCIWSLTKNLEDIIWLINKEELIKK